MGKRRLTSPRAVFLDRDGVLNRNVANPETGLPEGPLSAADFELIAGVPSALAALQDAGFLLFLVSNQPNYAKGKATLETLAAIHGKLEVALNLAGIRFAEFYYCLHHPTGVVREYSGPCPCRKPSPYFLFRASTQFGLDMQNSWMIGDRMTDVECGVAAGVKTILVGAGGSEARVGFGQLPHYVAIDLATAAGIMIGEPVTPSLP